jgi:hypothetical protein
VPGTAWAYVYANPVDGGKIFGVPFGGSTSTLLAMGGNLGAELTFDARGIYYSIESIDVAGVPNYAIGSMPISGGAQSTLTPLEPSTIDAIVSDGRNLYVSRNVTSYADGGSSVHGIIEAVPLAGGVPVTLAMVSEQPNGVAVDAQYVYWTQTGDSSPRANRAAGSVHRVPVTGGADETLATGQLNPRQVAVDASGLYWIDYGTMGVDCTSSDGSLVRLARGSASPVTLASGLKAPGALIAHSGTVYFATAGFFCNVGGAGLGSVQKFSAAAGQTTVVSSGITSPQSLYADDTYLYYAVVTDTLNYVLAAKSVPR